MSDRPVPGGIVGRRLVQLNLRPFGRPEAAFYELVAAPAVLGIVAPILERELVDAPAGAVLDVGCGGGAIAARLRRGDRPVTGVDPSIPQVRRARRRHDLPCAGATAEQLPFTDEAFAAVVSSCAVKHWPSQLHGISECSRVLRHGGLLVVVEIDGGKEESDLLRFAARTRIPRGLRRVYPSFARRSFVAVAPAPEAVADALVDAGLSEVRHWRVDGLPFFVVVGRRR